MPHLILERDLDLRKVADGLNLEVVRWRTAVLKTETVWVRADGRAVLVEGVVVEHSRAVHPVAVIETARGTTGVRLWKRVAVERTPAVQRWLAIVAGELQRLGAGALTTTNISGEILADLAIGDGVSA
jgi:hypothetical protein